MEEFLDDMDRDEIRHEEKLERKFNMSTIGKGHKGVLEVR